MSTAKQIGNSGKKADSWKKTSRSTIRNGDWLILKTPWGSYNLWHKDEYRGRFKSAEEAKSNAK